MGAISVIERRKDNLADELQDIIKETEDRMAADGFDDTSEEYVALRERRETVQNSLADAIATLNARKLAATPTPKLDQRGEQVSQMRQILREFDRGNSDRFEVGYEIQRAYHVVDSTEPLFKQDPTRIEVATLPVSTPTLDSIRAVPTGNMYNFTVPPPPVPAATVPEKGAKPGAEFTSTKVEGTLETDAHIVDVSRQTLEDDATAERVLKEWLREGVRLRQDAKAAAAIAGAVGTGTATANSLLAAIRQGKAELSKIGIVATTVYLHPDDAVEIDMDALIRGSNASALVQDVLWGLRVVENPGLTVGTAIVGSMPQAVYICYRNAINTYLTDSGMTVETTPVDRFSHNIIGVLGEGRSKVHVVQPKLLVTCTVAVPPLTARNAPKKP